MELPLDIETIPAQVDALERFIEETRENFKAPSSLTKIQAAKDLGLTDKNEIKYTKADEMIARWVREMPEINPDIITETAEKEWRKTSFDGGQGEIISIAWAVGLSGEIKSIQRNVGSDEKEMINSFFSQVLDSMNGRPPFSIGHNIPFDLKFLFRRCVVLDIDPGFPLPFAGRHGKDYFDNMQAWCGHPSQERISQDKLAKILGFKGKPQAIDGSQVWDYAEAGRIDEIAEYNRDDVDQVIKIYKKVAFR